MVVYTTWCAPYQRTHLLSPPAPPLHTYTCTQTRTQTRTRVVCVYMYVCTCARACLWFNIFFWLAIKLINRRNFVNWHTWIRSNWFRDGWEVYFPFRSVEDMISHDSYLQGAGYHRSKRWKPVHQEYFIRCFVDRGHWRPASIDSIFR